MPMPYGQRAKNCFAVVKAPKQKAGEITIIRSIKHISAYCIPSYKKRGGKEPKALETLPLSLSKGVAWLGAKAFAALESSNATPFCALL